MLFQNHTMFNHESIDDLKTEKLEYESLKMSEIFQRIIFSEKCNNQT